MKDVVDAFGLQKYFVLEHQVTGAFWDEARGLWDVHVTNLKTGEAFVDSAEIFINNGGLLK
jgi:cation diffusion facilitator CzcD-associated flavoprotein CzcO